VKGAAARAAAPFTPLPALALAVLAPAGTTVEVPWLLLGARFGVDETGRMFLLFTSFVWLIAGWFARGYLHGDQKRTRFWAFFLATQTGNLGLCLALDAATFYLLFALMTFCGYGLVIHAGTAEALRAGRVYLAMAMLGEAMLVAGILLLVYSGQNNHYFDALAAAPVTQLHATLLLCGFGIKAGILLLHMWLPLAHPVAPIPASAVLSGVMLKAGVLGWVRYLPLGSLALPETGQVLMGVGLLAMFYGVAVGVTQSNMKVLLAYSSISQMGFIALGVGAGLLAPQLWPLLLPAVTLYAFHHALAKSALFLGCGVVASTRKRHRVLAALAIPALALAGLTFTSGALVKSGLKVALADVPAPWPAWLHWLLPLAAVGTTLLMARFMLLAARRESNEHHRGMVLPWSLLLIAVLGSTWLLAPEGGFAYALKAGTLLSSTWPVVAGLILAAIAARSGRRVPAVPPGDLLLPVEKCLAWLGRCTLTAVSWLPSVLWDDRDLHLQLERIARHFTVERTVRGVLLLFIALTVARF